MAQVVTRQHPAADIQERMDGATRTLLLVVLAFIPVVLILAFYTAEGTGLLQYPAAMDHAQIARNILDGKGFTTDQLTPLAISFTDKRESIPDITYPPLYPILLALLFGVFGQSDAVVIFTSLSFYALSTLMVFLLTRRMFSLPAATLAAILFATQIEIVKQAASGTNTMAVAFIMLLTWYTLSSPHARMPRRYLRIGALFGVGFLTQYSFALFVPIAAAYAYFTESKQKWLCIAMFLLGVLIISFPWLIRNTELMHNPLFTVDQYDLLMNTGSFAGFNIHRTCDELPLPIVFGVTHITELFHKLLNGLVLMYWQWPMIIGMYVLPFFILALFSRVDNKDILAQRRLLLMFMAIQTIGVCLGDQMSMHLVKIAPLAMVFAAGYLMIMCNRLPGSQARKAFLLTVIVIGAALPTGMGLIKSAEVLSVGNTPPQFVEMGTILPKNAVVVTDCPWAVAWYGRRKAVWLPLNPRQLSDIERKVGRINAVFVSRNAASFIAMDPVALIKQLTQLGGSDSFHVARVYKEGGVLLTRPR